MLLFILLSVLSWGQDTVQVYSNGQKVFQLITFPDTVKVIVRDTVYVQVPVDTIAAPRDTIWRGIYVNSFNAVYNDQVKMDALIRDLNRWNMNSIHLYGLSSISSTDYPKLASAISRIKRETKVKDVVATAGSSTTFTGSRTTYNKAYGDTADFTGWNLEYESWNQTDITLGWTTNKSYLTQMKSGMTTGQVSSSVQYFGWWSKAPMATEAAPFLIANTTYGLIHDYRVSPDWAYMLSRMTDLNNAAKAAGKTFTVRVIFSAEPAFMQEYLKTHTLDQAYQALYAGYKSANLTNVKLDGYLVFHVDFLRVSQPYTNSSARVARVLNDPLFKNETTESHLKTAVDPTE
jgi:hypothetical protein